MEYPVYPGYSCTRDEEGVLKFSCTVYRQRYSAVQNVLETNKWANELKKIVDFGCANFKAFLYLKRLPHLEHMIGVDIDKEELSFGCSNIYPKLYDSVTSRRHPLKVEAYVGDVGVFDTRFKDVDAVFAIELIEHLYDDTLSKLPVTIFEKMRPKVAIFTTPNAEFNVLFNKMESEFRHYDHKFEWTREEFEKWANDILEKYPYYDVSFTGIGPGPEGTEHLGCCSQMAVFTLKDNIEFADDSLCQEENTPYSFEYGVDYPVDRREEMQRMKDDIKFYLYRECNYDDEVTVVTLSFLYQKLIEIETEDYEIDRETLLKTVRELEFDVDWYLGEFYILIHNFPDTESGGTIEDNDSNNYDEPSSFSEEEFWDDCYVSNEKENEEPVTTVREHYLIDYEISKDVFGDKSEILNEELDETKKRLFDDCDKLLLDEECIAPLNKNKVSFSNSFFKPLLFCSVVLCTMYFLRSRQFIAFKK